MTDDVEVFGYLSIDERIRRAKLKAMQIASHHYREMSERNYWTPERREEAAERARQQWRERKENSARSPG